MDAGGISLSSTNVYSHVDFTFEERFHVFKIENVLFRLPESILAKNSLFFEDLFLLPQPDGQESSDDNPTLVPDTSPEVFTKFCRWMFHLVSSDSLVAETDERIWMALLRFAHKFQIKRFFEDIISTIQKENTSADVNLSVSDVQRLNIWALFDLPIDWVTEPFLRICNRDERISDDEMLHLDLSVVPIIFALRDYRFSENLGELDSEHVVLELQRLRHIFRHYVRQNIELELASDAKSPSIITRDIQFYLIENVLTIQRNKTVFSFHEDLLAVAIYPQSLSPFDEFTDCDSFEFLLRYVYHCPTIQLAELPLKSTWDLLRLSSTLGYKRLSGEVLKHLRSLEAFDSFEELRLFECFRPSRSLFDPLPALRDICTSFDELDEKKMSSLSPQMFIFILKRRDRIFRSEIERIRTAHKRISGYRSRHDLSLQDPDLDNAFDEFLLTNGLSQ